MSNVQPGTRVSIIGMGLIGASVGAALRGSPGWSITAYDVNEGTRRAAEQAGCAHRYVDVLTDAIAGAELIVLATPVDAMPAILDDVAKVATDGCTIVDLGSTKRSIVAAMDALPDRLRAIGGHPMAGRQTSGVNGASADMYEGRKFVVVPGKRTDSIARQLVQRMIDDIGAIAVEMDAERHDRLLAMISHVPHFLSVPFLLATDEMNDELAWVLAAGGYRSIATHIADNPVMWRAIAESNGDQIADALRQVAQRMEAVANSLEARDATAISDVMHQALSLYGDHFDVNA